MPAVSYELHGDAGDGGGLRHQVARGAGDVGDDGAVLLQQAIEKAALADVGPAHDGQRQALAHQRAVLEARGQLARRPPRTGARRRRISAGRRHADIVFGEIDAGFEQRDQFQQLLLQRSDAPRNRAAGLLCGDARLVERGGVDQVADGLGLRQVDAAVAGKRAA